MMHVPSNLPVQFRVGMSRWHDGSFLPPSSRFGPVGVQIVAGRYREDLCLRAGEAIEVQGTPPSPIDPVGE